MRLAKPEFELTVVLTVVSGKEAVPQNLAALIPQIDFEKAEIIVPFDNSSSDVGSLAPVFPKVEFFFIENGEVGLSKKSADEHRLFDKRRAVGLRRSQGRIVAMTEDHALPATDWVSQIVSLHKQPYDVIGGAVENGIEKPLNRAVYYCDFGRYGRPFDRAEASYLSDVNIAYKRETLVSIQDVWLDAYHETTVHWALKRNGRKLFLDDRLVVYQNRNGITLMNALRERHRLGANFCGNADSRSHRFAATSFRFGFAPVTGNYARTGISSYAPAKAWGGDHDFDTPCRTDAFDCLVVGGIYRIHR